MIELQELYSSSGNFVFRLEGDEPASLVRKMSWSWSGNTTEMQQKNETTTLISCTYEAFDANSERFISASGHVEVSLEVLCQLVAGEKSIRQKLLNAVLSNDSLFGRFNLSGAVTDGN